LVTELAQRGAAVPEPGVEVGPDDSVWQVELAWPAAKTAVVIDDDAERDAWLASHSWSVTRAQGVAVDSLADSLTDQVGSGQ